MKLQFAVPVLLGLGLAAQQPRPIGTVASVDATAGRITLKTDAGPDMTVVLQDQTNFLRVAPGARDLKTAVKIGLAGVVAGDRILAEGHVAEDGKSITASTVIVMTKADIAKKQAADREEWRRRGVGGIVTALNPDAKEITISAHSLAGAKPMIITLKADAALRRYAPDSVKFSDAEPSTFADLKDGDQVRALGDKSEDGTHFVAEELVSGSFRNVAATVDSIDPNAKTLKIMDLATRKHLLVRVTPDSTLRRLSPFVARFVAMRNSASVPAARMHSNGPRGDSRAPDLQTMIERMPAITVADLKPGDAVIVASTNGAKPEQLSAITLLAGVEPLLTAAQPDGRRASLGSWNLNLDMDMGLP